MKEFIRWLYQGRYGERKPDLDGEHLPQDSFNNTSSFIAENVDASATDAHDSSSPEPKSRKARSNSRDSARSSISSEFFEYIKRKNELKDLKRRTQLGDLVLHTKMWKIADCYGVRNLKEHAEHRLQEDIPHCKWDPSIILKIIPTIYEITTAEGDRKLRETVVSFVTKCRYDIMQEQRWTFHELKADCDEFNIDITEALMKTGSPRRWSWETPSSQNGS